MEDTSKNYKYLGITTSVCEDCLNLVPTKIIEEDGTIFFYKNCNEHGTQKTKISTDIDYYMKCMDPRYQTFCAPYKLAAENEGCPKDCGLCNNHEQKTCMAMVELTNDCNISCSTCIAGSCPGGKNYITLEEMNKIIDSLYIHQDTIDLLMLSGGEPTIHPKIFEIIDLCKERNVKHIMLITNGVKIANDIDFVKEIAKRKENLEIYLQFDSLRTESLMDIRGIDLSDIRKKSVENLEKYKIHSTLVCIIKKGTNDNELKEIIDYARSYKYIRGITLQPLKNIGRGNDFDKNKNYITLTEVRDKIAETGIMSKHNIIPHPCNTSCISIGYLNENGDELTHFLFSDFTNSAKLKEFMYYIPELDTENTKYESLFRITIVSFLDRYNFNLNDVKKSCIHFVSPDGKIVPFDTHYVYHS